MLIADALHLMDIAGDRLLVRVSPDGEARLEALCTDGRGVATGLTLIHLTRDDALLLAAYLERAARGGITQ
jgi:hypothetical protein